MRRDLSYLVVVAAIVAVDGWRRSCLTRTDLFCPEGSGSAKGDARYSHVSIEVEVLSVFVRCRIWRHCKSGFQKEFSEEHFDAKRQSRRGANAAGESPDRTGYKLNTYSSSSAGPESTGRCARPSRKERSVPAPCERQPSRDSAGSISRGMVGLALRALSSGGGLTGVRSSWKASCFCLARGIPLTDHIYGSRMTY